MSKPAQLIYTQKVNTILKIQLILITIFTAIVYIGFGKQAAQAYILGSLIAWVAHYIFTISTFKYVGAKAKSNIVHSMYKGQVLKWFMTIFSFLLIMYLFKNIAVQFLILGFVLVQLKNWLFLFVK